jgi:phenylpyruvate tautomerase PptA (4-oxalocrotonate tautomerase family)
MTPCGAAQLGVSPDDVFINLVEVQRENWSFGKEFAQFVPQPETK